MQVQDRAREGKERVGERVMEGMVEVIWLEDIREYREVFACEECGRKAYCLDPGDGLPTHLGPDDVTEFQEDFC